MRHPFHIEVESVSLPRLGQHCCGDVTLSRKLKDENRVITILSDGSDGGVKANILASMTTSMAMQMVINHEPIERITDFILQTLPFNQTRRMVSTTFTLLDIDYKGTARLVEFNNPPVVLLRQGNQQSIDQRVSSLCTNGINYQLIRSEFELKIEDRLLLCSDGVLRSGTGTRKHPMGWNHQMIRYAEAQIQEQPDISARSMAHKIVARANHLEGGKLRDDTTSCVIYCRAPRRILLASGPPYHKPHDKTLAQDIRDFKGKKVICGGTTATIVSRELNLPVETDLHLTDPELPPLSKMKGIDLVTEGILTLGKLSRLLESTEINGAMQSGPAHELYRILMESDEIVIMAGTRINEAHHDPNMPVELEIRRNVLKKIASLLEEKYLKQVDIQFL